MKVIVTSIFVDDQEKAKTFYSEKLGFEVKHDIDMGGGHKWLTVVSKEQENGTEIVLEPNEHPAAKDYQSRLFEEGIPVTMFGSDDLNKEYEELKANGVTFTKEPTQAGDVKLAIFDDTCGNLIQIVEQ